MLEKDIYKKDYVSRTCRLSISRGDEGLLEGSGELRMIENDSTTLFP